jgi:hypothetical protein
MRKRNVNSQALRQLAHELFDEIAAHGGIQEEQREEFATSMVRQWITYDGNATLLVEDQQVYLVLAKTPLGKPSIVPEPALPGWMNCLREDWKISPDDLPEVIEQLNRGQSAEVVNGDGIPLRLWVNPKERTKGVEPLVQEDIPAGTKRDYQKIATHVLERQLGPDMDPDEMEALACSVAKQWQRFEGHASIFLDAERQLALRIVEKDDGGCEVGAKWMPVNLEAALAGFGLPTEVHPDVIARINLGQEIEFVDQKGIRSRLWHDPKARRIITQPVHPGLL